MDATNSAVVSSPARGANSRTHTGDVENSSEDFIRQEGPRDILCQIFGVGLSNQWTTYRAYLTLLDGVTVSDTPCVDIYRTYRSSELGLLDGTGAVQPGCNR